jgi:hypothetical protein
MTYNQLPDFYKVYQNSEDLGKPNTSETNVPDLGHLTAIQTVEESLKH